MSQHNSNNFIVLALVAVLTVFALAFFMQPKETSGTKLGKAMDKMADGIKDAADELKPNKTPGEKIGDAVKDVGDSIKDAAN